MLRGLVSLLARAIGMPGSRSLGDLGEAAAEKLLRGKGYEIVAKNVWLKFGEADLVARDPRDARGPTLVVVEVKARVRRESSQGKSAKVAPEAAVTARKKAKLRRLANTLADANGGGPRRVDVVSVEFPQSAAGTLGEPMIRHYIDAVRGGRGR